MVVVIICSDPGAHKIKVSHCFHCFPIYLPWSDRTKCHDLHSLNVEFKPDVSLSYFTFIKRLFSSPSISAMKVMSSVYLRIMIFPPAILIPACASCSWAFHMKFSAYKLNKQGDNIQPLYTPFPIWNQSALPCSVLHIASWPAYRFLWRQVRSSGVPISVSFPWFVVIHTVKDFCMVNKSEVGVFLEFSCFFYDPTNVDNLISGSSPFLNPAWTYGISQFMSCSRLAWRNYFGSMWDECNCVVVEHSFKSPFLGIARKTTFPVLWSLLSFPHVLAYWVQHINTIIF